jgi:predicted kinase
MKERLQHPEMIIMMGLQGSGKTTLCTQKFIAEGFVHISMDVLKNRRREEAALQECLSESRSCVIDNTNPTRAERERYITKAKQNGFRIVGYFMQSRLKDCIARNEGRDRQVPLKGILATFNKIEMPSLQEGFDELNFVSIEEGKFVISKWKEDEI